MIPPRICLVTLVVFASACERATPSVEKPAVATTSARPSAASTPPLSVPSALPATSASSARGPSASSHATLALEKFRRHDEKPAKSPSAIGETVCSVDAEYPVVLGIDPAVARHINAALEPKDAKLEPECDQATSYEVRYTVVVNEAGFLSVVFDENWCCGAHPSYSKRFVNARTRDGKVLTVENLFRPGSPKKIATRLHAMAKKEFAKDDVWNDYLEEQTGEARDFSLERGGVRFSFFNAAPHAVQSAFRDGFFVPCRDLDALGLVAGALESLCPRK